MDEDEESPNDVVEIDSAHFVEVEMTREWPRYVATWSVRRRAGDTTFPVETGRIERVPPRDPDQLDAMLDDLRTEARETAMRAASERAPSSASGNQGGSFLGKLFHRRSG